jgi:two-component system response regulator FixJ
MAEQREHRQTVYVVDDDDSVRKALRRLLVAVGYVVETFASAREFLGATSAESSGCLILDVHMPDMDGLQLQEELNSAGSHLPVILITADKDPGVGERGARGGAVGFLQKPLDDTSLLCLVNAALAGADR